MSNEMRDWQADEIQELKGLIKELEAIIAIRNVRIAPEPLDMERWVQLSHCAVLEAEKTSTPDAPRNPDDTLYYWAFQTLAIQESAITDQQARIEALTKAVDSFTALINESGGVYGLHLNGDPAPWAELMIGGRFEEWLLPLALLNKQEPSND